MKILGLGAGATDEGIVRRHGAVVAEALRLSHVIIPTLRLHPEAVVVSAIAAEAVAVADGYVEASGVKKTLPAELRSVSHAKGTFLSLSQFDPFGSLAGAGPLSRTATVHSRPAC